MAAAVGRAPGIAPPPLQIVALRPNFGAAILFPPPPPPFILPPLPPLRNAWIYRDTVFAYDSPIYNSFIPLLGDIVTFAELDPGHCYTVMTIRFGLDICIGCVNPASIEAWLNHPIQAHVNYVQPGAALFTIDALHY